MSTWVAPITWANGAVTAAQMNAEIRDHCTFLKGALDLITNNTTADTGTSTYLSVTRATSSVPVLTSYVSGDSEPRLSIAASGHCYWGSGAATYDTRIYRTSAGHLVFDTNSASSTTKLQIQSTAGQQSRLWMDVAGDSDSRVILAGDATSTGLYLGSGAAAVDVSLYRGGANKLYTDDAMYSIRTSSSDGCFYAMVSGESYPRQVVTAGGNLYWGSGATDVDTVLYRSAAHDLRSDDHFYAAELAVPVKVGVPADGDFTIDMSGNCCLDTTNSRIYFRVGSTWKYAALT